MQVVQHGNPDGSVTTTQDRIIGSKYKEFGNDLKFFSISVEQLNTLGGSEGYRFVAINDPGQRLIQSTKVTFI